MARILSRVVLSTGVALGVAAAGPQGCSNYGGVTLGDGGLPSNGSDSPFGGSSGTSSGGTVPTGQGVGQPCNSTTMTCRAGLTCEASGTCAPCGCVASGMACTLNDDCAMGLYCGPGTTGGTMRTCTTAGMGAAGGSCTSDADCGTGLRCNLAGLSAVCQTEGTKDVGGACMTSADCLGGLGCESNVCEPFPPGTPTVPLAFPPTWPGATCTDDPAPTKAYFEVPRDTEDGGLSGDFYRLPFPNDVRQTFANGVVGMVGKIDLSGHPTPGSALFGYDLVQRWITDLENTVEGFSTYPTVFFRFNAGVDIGGTLKGKNALQFVDITTPAKPVSLNFTWVAQTNGNAYICNNWMAVRPQQGVPLTPLHTYAVVLASTVLDSNKNTISVSPDLTALLAATPPTDTALLAQYPKYKPLRDWLTGQNMATSTVLNATVFTVGNPSAIGPKIAAAVTAATTATPITATGWFLCGGSGADGGPATDPCPQATGDRACPATPDPSFDELHALVSLPIFQTGTEPYSNPPDGDFMLDATGTPIVQRTEKVCMSLTVPKGTGVTMPTTGWPLLVYAHGTGGSYRSEASDGTAARMASVDNATGGGQTHIAMLGIDQVETGPRRGASTESPDNLFYNFTNPGAARGNTLQGGADQLSLLHFVTGFDLTAANSPTGAEIKFGPVAFWGHSQGATEGGIAMPYATTVLGAVLSGEGASLEDALVTKTNPVNIVAALPVALQDPAAGNCSGCVGVNHPVLALLQNDLGLVDPLNYASALVANPIAAANQKHVFQPFGQMDSYAPPVTEETFAIAAQLNEAAPPSGVTDSPSWVSMPLPVPAGDNQMVTPPGGTTAKPITAIVRQYVPGSTYDGHFVSYDNTQAEADVNHFVCDSLNGLVPKVGR